MFLLKALTAGIIVVASVGVASRHPAAADIVKPPEGGATVVVNLQTDGTVFDDSGTRVRPCPDGYTFRASWGREVPLSPSTERVTRTLDDVEQVLFFTGCVVNVPGGDVPQFVNESSVWVGLPNGGAVIEEAFAQVQKLIYPPVVSWPTMDREFNWLYVKAPMEFRVAALTSVTATASLTNILGSVTATQTATPVSVTFFPGEPGGVPVVCSIAGATAPFAVDVIGECSYSYNNSSAIAPGAVFDARLVVTWQVTGDLQPGDATTLETFVESPLAVAEAQAVVTG